MRKGHVLFWISILLQFALAIAAFAYSIGIWIEIGYNGLSVFIILVGSVSAYMCGCMIGYWVEYKKTNK